MLTVTELRDYKNWIGKSPVEIRQAALQAGGWSHVFATHISSKEPAEFPVWASRVRNYFNETPASLKLLPTWDAWHRLLTIKDRMVTFLPGAHDFALSGDVYLDDTKRAWFAMSPGGTVYHYPGKVDNWKIAGAILASQSRIPVFKLISPDDTGGSLELVVHNPQVNKVTLPWGDAVYVGEQTIGREGTASNIVTRTVTDEVYRGSYNYSETVIMGFDEHDYRDVKPHSEEKGFYINPAAYSSAASRRFPVTDGMGRNLAD